ncbi:MAG TPA: hypothetical protein VK870_12075 [Ignavibacteriaceae bacterium]|nr:hypothetical protein [Ignavibacteriaceae bacterium]
MAQHVVAFLICWIRLLSVSIPIRKYLLSLLKDKTLQSIDELIEAEKKKEIEESLKKDSNDKL